MHIYYLDTYTKVKEKRTYVSKVIKTNKITSQFKSFSKTYTTRLYEKNFTEKYFISDELLKLVRKQHPEQNSIKEMDEAQKKLNLLNPKIYKFNNTEECCKTNGANSKMAPALAWTSIVAMSILKRL